MLLLVDGNSLVHRAYHAFPKSFTSPVTGEPTGAIYGFTRILLLAIKRYRPALLAVAYDPPGKTFRDEAYAQYKATRLEADPALYAQIPRTKEVVSALGISVCEVEGFEADDVIATLVASNRGQVIVMSGDRDLWQLVSSRVTAIMPASGKGGAVEYSPKGVMDALGLRPDQIVDYKALRGDPSDNYPGVPGIGEKTAVKLLHEAGSLERLLKRPPEKYRALLADHRAAIELSKVLAELRTDVPVNCDLHFRRHYEHKQAIKLFSTLGFRSLLKDLPAGESTTGQSTLL